MYSSATKGSWPQKKNPLQCVTAGCSFSRCSHLIFKVFTSFTLKYSVDNYSITSWACIFIVENTVFNMVSWSIKFRYYQTACKECEELALNDIICSWACGLSFQSAWTLQLIWEVTAPEPAISCTGNASENSSANSSTKITIRVFYSYSTLCHAMASHTELTKKPSPKNPAQDATGHNPTTNCYCRNRADKNKEKKA